jgi:hypothetical protein
LFVRWWRCHLLPRSQYSSIITNGVYFIDSFLGGKRPDRPALDKALAAARLHRASLVVSKVDRLTRSVAFLSRLLEAGVDVRFADLPQIEGATGRGRDAISAVGWQSIAGSSAGNRTVPSKKTPRGECPIAALSPGRVNR